MKYKIISFILMLFVVTLAKAVVYPAAPFKSGMVLQQKSNVALWGKAKANAVVTIAPTWTEETFSCQVDAFGKWRISIPTPEASLTHQRIVFSDGVGNATTLSNILIGEVWVSSGQSNMEMPVRGWASSPIHNVDSIVESASKYTDKLRFVTVPETGQRYPQDSARINWQTCSKSSVREFSVVAYFFATHLIDSLNIPVGIINASYGGSCVEAWIPAETNRLLGTMLMDDAAYANITQNTLSANYNAMVHPLRGYTISGFIWYQGENNVYTRYQQYALHLSNMISSWRNVWGQGDLPFYIVELAPYYYNDVNATNGAFTRELQNVVQHTLPNVRLVSTNDLILPNETQQIHPAHKLGVGQRLGNLALHDVYGYTHLRPYHPELVKASFHDGKAYLQFSHCEDGFNLTSGITGFEVSGSNGVFRTATAVVENGEVVLSAANVASPVAARYCYRNFLMGNLKNKAGLPPLPFRTDGSLITTIPDETWVTGERLSADDLKAGDTIIIAGASCIEANSYFFNGTSMQKGATNSCAFRLEQAPKVEQTGHSAFYLRHLDSGFYVSANNIDNSGVANNGAPLLVDLDKAATFVIASAKDSILPTSTRTPGWDDLSICLVHEGFGARGYFGRYLCHQWDSEQALVSSYRYLCAWNAYRAHRSSDPRQPLVAAVSHANMMKSLYAAGMDPGFVETDYYNEFVQLADQANAGLYSALPSGGAEQLAADLEDHVKGLNTHSVPLTEGFYTIVNANPSFRTVQHKEKVLYAGDDGLLHWGDAADDIAQYAFRLDEATDGSGRKALFSVAAQAYIGRATGKTKVGLSAEPLFDMKISHYSRGQWTITPVGATEDLCAGNNGNGSTETGLVTIKTDLYNTASTWYLRKITDAETISRLRASGLYIQLQNVLKSCQALMDSTSVGQGVGDVDQADNDLFQQVLDEAAAVKVDDAESYIAQVMEKLQTERILFRNARHTFEDGRWYYIINMDGAANSAFAGQAMGLLSNNTTDCYRWSATADILTWGGRASSADEQPAYLHNPLFMWRFVTRADGGGVALQNRATGTYLNNAPSSNRYGMSAAATDWRADVLGHAQLQLTPLNGSATAQPIGAVTSASAVQSINGGFNTPAAWNLEAVADDEVLSYLEVAAPVGKYAIMCLPFAVSGLESPDGDVRTYRLHSLHSEQTLNLTSATEFSAGEPFFILIGQERASVLSGTLRVAPESNFVTEGLTSNGLVGVLDKQQVSGQGLLYFNTSYALKESTRLPFVLEGHTGYVDPTQVETSTDQIDLTIGKNAVGIHAVSLDGQTVDVYSVDGRLVRSGVLSSQAAQGLSKGIYIIGGQKVVVD